MRFTYIIFKNATIVVYAGLRVKHGAHLHEGSKIHIHHKSACLSKAYIHDCFCSLFTMQFYVCSLHNITADCDHTAEQDY